MDGVGATAGRAFPASWMTAQNMQYSTAAGADGFDWAEISAEPSSMAPIAGWEFGQQTVGPQCT
jgi:hypothetical protein